MKYVYKFKLKPGPNTVTPAVLVPRNVHPRNPSACEADEGAHFFRSPTA